MRSPNCLSVMSPYVCCLFFIGASLSFIDSHAIAEPMKLVAGPTSKLASAQLTKVMEEHPAEVEIDKQQVQVAEPFTFVLKVYHSNDQRVVFSPVPAELGPFAVLDQQQQLDLPTSIGRESILTLQMEAWEAGQHTLPGIEYEIQNVEPLNSSGSQEAGARVGEATRHVSPERTLEVVSVRKEGEDLLQLRELASAQDATALPSVTAVHWSWYLSVPAVLAALLLLGVWVRRRPKSQPSVARWALDRLSELRRPSAASIDGVAISDAVRLSRASVIMRDYLTLRFGLSANVGTGTETLGDLQSQGWSPAFVARLQRWLSLAEQVSFAGVDVNSSDVDQAIEEAKALVAEAEAMQPVLDQNDQQDFPPSHPGIASSTVKSGGAT